MDYQFIKLKEVGQVMEIVLNRPEKKNAISKKMLLELYHAADSLYNNKSVKVILIKGNNDFFSAGGDLTDIMETSAEDAPQLGIQVQEVFMKFTTLPQIVIACLRGVVMGGGAELSLYCDIRLAHENMVFSMPELKHQMIPGAGGISLLTRYIGIHNALYYFVSGSAISSQTALQLGLVQMIYSDDNFTSSCNQLAEYICKQNSEVVATAKRIAWMNLSAPINECLIEEAHEFGSILNRFGKDEIRNFMEKKKTVN